MINECVEGEEPFGVVRLNGERETSATIDKVGVLARVSDVERLEDGRMNILTEGEERFRVLKLIDPTPFWRAAVELLEDRPEPGSALEQLCAEVSELYITAYRIGVELTGGEPAHLELPESPLDLSFVVAYVLDLDPSEKQRLLELTSTRDRLGALISHLRSTNENLKQQVHRKQNAEKARGNGDLGSPGGL